jgi:hypothetical protein
MTTFVSVVALLLVAITMALSLAHALEFPGKLRLDEATYRAVQAIYYPGFTIGGFGEFGALVVLPVLLFLTPFETDRFWWIAAAFLFLLISHAIYWFVTHPVNHIWLKDSDVAGMGALFFSRFAGPEADWKHLRNVWEYSHIARACCGMISLISMAVALTR